MDDNVTVTELAHAAAAGDQDAWNRLVDRYMPLVRSVIRSYGLTGQDAEDVNQTLWLRLVEHLGDIREPRALPGWISTTTRNECVKLVRGARRTVPMDTTLESDTRAAVDRVPVDQELLRAERHQVLLEAFAELPDNQRELLLLLLVDPPLPYTEVSRRLGMPIGSIGPTRARALRRLRECHAMTAMIEMDSEVNR